MNSEYQAKLAKARQQAVRMTQWTSWTALLLAFAAIWAWPYGFGGRLLLTSGLLFVVSIYSVATVAHADSLKGSTKGAQHQRAGAGSVSFQAGRDLHVPGQRPAAGRVEAMPMTARPQPPRK